MASSQNRRRPWARALLVSGLLFGLTARARATWSIVAVDRNTGEVCIAGATCLTSTDLRRGLAVMAVGKGGAVAQSSGDSGAINRMRMWNTIHAGASADRVLLDLLFNGTPQISRQYGIVTLDSAPAAWSGLIVGMSKCEVFSEVGSLAYSIQGNVLTGPAVCYEAEQTLLETPGDLGQKVMAAMESARSMGGDGRCSCHPNRPDSCGAPPEEFDKSAHVSFLVLSRLGDTDGICNASMGCANGDYYLALDVIRGVAAPDPIVELQREYDRWRRFMRGVPDHLLSQIEPGMDQLTADGASTTDVLVRLVDLEGDPLQHGGQQLSVTYTGELPERAVAGPPVDQGDGSFLFPVTATTVPGRASWRVDVVQGMHDVQLHPELAIEVVP